MNIIERIEVALEKAKENVFEKHMPPQDSDIDIVLVDAMLAIKELKQQVSELHASRESLLEYKGKIESEEFVLVSKASIGCIVLHEDATNLDDEITELSSKFSEESFLDGAQEDDLELLVAKSMKLGELYERRRIQNSIK